MQRKVAIAIGVLTAALLGGCAHPVIDRTQYARPKTVAIVDFPDVKPAATIALLMPQVPSSYFAGRYDPYFVPAGGQFSLPNTPEMLALGMTAGAMAGRQAARANHTSKAAGTAGGAVVGLAIGALIDAGAQETQKKAEGYPALVQTVMPGIDIRTEVLAALRTSLEAKGIAVSMLVDSRNLAPRLRWPAVIKYPLATQVEEGELPNSAPVDVDIVAQIVPLVAYASPGPLNNYNSEVGIGLALFDGRTRKFLGWQAFRSTQNTLWYARYDSLVQDIGKAAPAQFDALMSVIPQVSDAISNGQ